MSDEYFKYLVSLDFDKMTQDEFIDWVRFYYGDVAKSYKCKIKVSESRAAEAYILIRRDLDKLLHEMSEDSGTVRLDEFKCAAYITYWLRRRVVINNVMNMPTPIAGIDPDRITPLQEAFIVASSELCSFLVGLNYCAIRQPGGLKNASDAQLVSASYVSSVARLLKEKNVSPHALFLIFGSIFGNYTD